MPPKKETPHDGFSLLRNGLGVGGFRSIVLILLLSMHPVGRQILGTFGFEFPDQKKLSVAAEQASTVKQDVQALTISLNEVRTDLNTIKANYSSMNTKVDSLDRSFQGFQVDFQKLKPPTTPK